LGLSAADLLEVTPQVVSAANPAVFIAVKDIAAVDRAWLDSHGLKMLRGENSEPLLTFVFAPTPEGAYSRMFAPEHGIAEDPATGSATGPLAAVMMRNGLVASAAGTRFVSEQGTKMGRRSLLHVLICGKDGAEGIDVGGHVTPVISGELQLT